MRRLALVSASLLFGATPLAEVFGWDVIAPLAFGFAGLCLVDALALVILELEDEA